MYGLLSKRLLKSGRNDPIAPQHLPAFRQVEPENFGREWAKLGGQTASFL